MGNSVSRNEQIDQHNGSPAWRSVCAVYHGCGASAIDRGVLYLYDKRHMPNILCNRGLDLDFNILP